MQLSPLQLLDLKFHHIRIDSRVMPDQVDLNYWKGFNFKGVKIKEDFSYNHFIDSETGKSTHGVILRIVIDNQHGTSCPYNVDIEVSGHFFFPEKSIESGKEEEIAAVNGSAMLFSAIREQVINITSRSLNGPLSLPSVNFLDKIKDIANKKPSNVKSPDQEKKTKKSNKK